MSKKDILNETLIRLGNIEYERVKKIISDKESFIAGYGGGVIDTLAHKNIDLEKIFKEAKKE